MKKNLIRMACMAAVAGAALSFAQVDAAAQTAKKPAYKAPKGGKTISDQILGTFFEDLSYAADGGLNAQLVQNGSFEYNLTEQPGWGAGTAWRFSALGHSTGYVSQRNDNPLNANNENYMRITAERVGRYLEGQKPHVHDHGQEARNQDGSLAVAGFMRDTRVGVGIINSGFDGMVVKAGENYDFSAFMRMPDGKAKTIKVWLTAGRTVLAEQTIKASSKDWTKYEVILTPDADAANASLMVATQDTGCFDIDAVSLIPEDTFMGHGLRKDLAQAIADMHPKFVRFPGGCVVHGGGDGMWATYRWKTSIGPKEERVQLKNSWGYHQSREIGYYEYFQFCEDINAKPLPILPSGTSCQGAGGSWGLPGFAQMPVPMDEMDEWVDEVLDLIEWANGDVTTEWGAKRAAQGHPEPFGLELVGIGNEEYITPEFEERFQYIYDRVTAAHPEITIVGTAGVNSHPSNKEDYVNGWAFAEKIGVPILDEHYYEQKEYFLTSRQYDSYPRDRKTKVYLGEYAAKDNTVLDALAEALYLCHVERNGDVVIMSSYAPLMSNMNHSNWLPVLILFNNDHVALTANYYVQQMFGESAGTKFYGNCVKIAGADNLQEQSVVLNPEKRELYIKVCNASDQTKTADINLSIFSGIKKGMKASIKTLKGQPTDRNDINSQPIVPVESDITVAPKMTFDIEPYSFSMITVKL